MTSKYADDNLCKYMFVLKSSQLTIFIYIFSGIVFFFIFYFYAPALKGPSGASSNLIVCPPVCLLFRPAYKQSPIIKVLVMIW